MYKQYKIIALCISRVSDTRHFEFITEFNKHINDKGYRLFVYQTCSELYGDSRNEDGEKIVFNLIDYSITDAIIIWDEAFHDKSILEVVCSKAKANAVPVISVGASRKNCININFEYVTGFEQIVRHVVEYHKISDIFLVAGIKDNSFSDDRINIYKKVLEENGIEFNSDMLGYGDFWDGPTREIITSLVNEHKVPRAIVCINDMMAITTCNVLQANGYVIPDDVIVTGFDGTDEANYCTPSITTCGCDFVEMSRLIINILSSAIDGEDMNGEYAMSFRPVIEGSCGCKTSDRRNNINTGQMLKMHNDRFHIYRENERLMYGMSSEAIACKSSKEFVAYLENFRFSDIRVVVNTECFDNSINPGTFVCNDFDDDMYEIYADDIPSEQLPILIKRTDILSNLDEILSKNRPLIFAALTYIGMPIGYICFYFDVDMNNYCRVMQFVTLINTIVSGYRNMQHLQYTAKAMENMYKYDHLTGLFNRHAFYNELKNLVLTDDSDEGAQYIVVTIDLDGLKHINDTYGHQAGDFAISTVAYAVRNLPVQNKLCGRFGGDEMVICVKTAHAMEEAEQIRTHIKHYLDYINRTSGKPYEVSVSMGIALCGGDGFDFDKAFKESDKLMYTDKINRKAVRR